MKYFSSIENYIGGLISERGIFGPNGFFYKYKYLILTTFLAGVITNITDITNIYYGPDSIDAIYENYFKKFTYINLRFGSSILLATLPFLSIYGISQITGLFFLSLAAILIIYRFNISIIAKAIFCILFVTHPVWSHLEAFHFQYAYNTLGVLGAVGAILFLLNGYERRCSFKISLVISFLILLFAISIYQSTVAIFISVAVLFSFFIYIEDKDFKKSIKFLLWSAIITFFSVVIYYIICKIVTNGFGNYQNGAFFFNDDIPIIKMIGYRLTHIYRFLFGVRDFSSTHGINATFAFIISLIIIFFRYENNDRGRIILLAFIFLLSILFYTLFISKTVWVYFNLPLYFSFSFLLLYIFSKSNIGKGVVLVFAIFTLFQNMGSVQLNQQAARIVSEQDKRIVERILDIIYDKAPEVYNGEKAIVFIGSIEYNSNKKDPNNYRHPFLKKAHSQYSRGLFKYNLQEEIKGMLTLYGLPTNVHVINERSSLYNLVNLIANDDPRYLLAVDIQRDMPSYPDRGCVRVEDDFVIVKLSDLKEK